MMAPFNGSIFQLKGFYKRVFSGLKDLNETQTLDESVSAK